MGQPFSEFFPFIKPIRVLLLGLEKSGKTSILHRLRDGHLKKFPVPTVSVSLQRIFWRKIEFEVVDISLGGSQIYGRTLRKHHYANAKAVIFAIDSADLSRVEDAKSELIKTMKLDTLKSLPFLILATKSDEEKPVEVKRLRRYFMEGKEVIHIEDESLWEVFSVSATTGDGLDSALEWLAKMIRHKKFSGVANLDIGLSIAAPGGFEAALNS